MLMRIRVGESISVGCCFYRYFPTMGYCYNKVEVLTLDEFGCEVDFGDTLVRYLHSEIAYVYNTDMSDEHHMSLEDGKLIADYRSAPTTLTESRDDPVLASFEELLKRI